MAHHDLEKILSVNESTFILFDDVKKLVNLAVNLIEQIGNRLIGEGVETSIQSMDFYIDSYRKSISIYVNMMLACSRKSSFRA